MLDLMFAGHSGAVLLFLVGSALVAGMARGFSGFGAALVFVPLASAAIGPKLAVPLLLVIDAATSLGMIPNAWRNADKREVGMMSLGALVGVPVGTYVLANADPLTIRWAIVGLVAVMLALLMSGWRYHGRPKAAITVGVGAASGFCGGAAQVGGPPVIAYWLGGAVKPVTVRANIVLYFAVSSAINIVAYMVGGLFSREILALALLTAPAYAAGLFVGSHMFGMTSERTFRAICYSLIAFAALVSLPVLDGVLR